MKLNHLDLQVLDVQQSVLLFEELFGFELQTNRTSPAIAILSDREGFTLVLQKRKDPTETYPDGFHLGFLVDDVALVHALHAQAKARGLHVSDVSENSRGVMVYLRTDDGILIEVSRRR